MPALASLDKSRVRYHLRYTANSIPAGDFERLETQMISIADDYTVQRVRVHLDRCDAAFERSAAGGSSGYDRRQLVTGDINRATITSTSKDFIQSWRAYLAETDHLAYLLNVPNYADPEQGYGRWVRYGDAAVLAANIGVPDTCTGDRIYLAANYT